MMKKLVDLVVVSVQTKFVFLSNVFLSSLLTTTPYLREIKLFKWFLKRVNEESALKIGKIDLKEG